MACMLTTRERLACSSELIIHYSHKVITIENVNINFIEVDLFKSTRTITMKFSHYHNQWSPERGQTETRGPLTEKGNQYLHKS